MASRSANPRDLLYEPEWSMTGFLAGIAAPLVARPKLVGGTIAAALLCGFFGSNALFYQKQEHPRALFATRSVAFDQTAVRETAQLATRNSLTGETRIVVEDEAPQKAVAPAKRGDPMVASVQKSLNDLGLYDGPVDGLSGPKTETAILAYQKILGLAQSGEVDADLLRALNLSPETVASIPTPSPRPQSIAPQPMPELPKAADGNLAGDAEIVARIQAGLRAFGNVDIEIDGKAGPRTREAIREFQTLFRMDQDGLPSGLVEAKMREIGLLSN